MELNLDCLAFKLETGCVLLSVQNKLGPWWRDYFTINDLLCMAWCLSPAEAVREQRGCYDTKEDSPGISSPVLLLDHHSVRGRVYEARSNVSIQLTLKLEHTHKWDI